LKKSKSRKDHAKQKQLTPKFGGNMVDFLAKIGVMVILAFLLWCVMHMAASVVEHLIR